MRPIDPLAAHIGAHGFGSLWSPRAAALRLVVCVLIRTRFPFAVLTTVLVPALPACSGLTSPSADAGRSPNDAGSTTDTGIPSDAPIDASADAEATSEMAIVGPPDGGCPSGTSLPPCLTVPFEHPTTATVSATLGPAGDP